MFILYYAIALIVIGIDQLTKWLVLKNMYIGESIEVIPNFFFITSTRNTGAAFSILEGQMWLFYVITVAVVAGIIYYIQKYAKNRLLLGISLGLILGGAVGNFIDRLFRSEVVDFVHLRFGSYDFAVFNAADSSLTIGVVLLFIFMLFDERKTKEKIDRKNGPHRS
ncbi:lipoprotein signal peptidase [Weizmannia acidilactici]|uniref:Lipoprotein signal peptidase n=1 Tax=Weizmannia acidilactici TaxID=2607726 RepID=A0A5J4J696_9BACI|nr:signal peptidase II [Weizmannia acidilactici]GER65542.1 lipoprotein signal peptidase [Weizmannia acidilactici]GER70446.1 lipoprotein signal peptidase [Weizmannia acidilactici]GER74082.1 lipoprotein signal peptidase [Weizmannia acidilactici]